MLTADIRPAESAIENAVLVPIEGSGKRTRRKSDLVAANVFFATDGQPGTEWASEARAYALGQGFVPEEIGIIATRFRNHHIAKGSRFEVWIAAWRNWLSRETPSVSGQKSFGSSARQTKSGWATAEAEAWGQE